jgi:glycosyltransferase involved in cell wall biosynthesis
MKVLIVSMVFSPSGSVATERMRKFIKYTSIKNIDVLCLSEQGLINIRGEQEIDRQSFDEIANKFNRVPKKENRSIKSFISIVMLILSLVRIPDKYSLHASKLYSRFSFDEKYDAILATGPVFSNHLLGFYISKKLKCKLILDYRDPWTINDDYYKSKLSIFFWMNRILESIFIRSAQKILVTTESFKIKMIKEFKLDEKKLVIIPNGYD